MEPRPVLIIDDDRLIQRVLERAFNEKGWHALSAGDAETGLEMIRLKKPEVLVLDIFLPGKWSGLEFLKIIKNDPELKGITVVMMTAGDPARYMIPCKEAGAEFIAPKPFSPKAFVHQVEMLIKKKEGQG